MVPGFEINPQVGRTDSFPAHSPIIQVCLGLRTPFLNNLTQPPQLSSGWMADAPARPSKLN